MAETTTAQITRYLTKARAIAWDECHKIYILRDDETLVEFEQYGFYQVLLTDDFTVPQLREILHEWYLRSCDLKFISAVAQNRSSKNVGFRALVRQFDDWDR